MAVTDHIVPDNPTNNFATLNPLDKALRNGVLSEGNLKSTDSTSNWSTNYLNIVPKSGVYYVEFYSLETATTSGAGIFVGNKRTWPDVYTGSGYPYDTNTFGIYQNGTIYYNNSVTSYAGSWTDGDVISLIVDYNTRNFWFRVNNSIVSGDDHTGSQSGGVASKLSLSSGLPDGDMFIYIIQRGQSDNTAVSQMYVNTGQDSSFGGNKTSGSANASDANGHGDFYYTPPTGALALCTQNIPTPSIDSAVGDEPEDYFKTVTWTGNGSSRNIAVGFQPDLVWIKNRNNSSQSTHAPSIFDSARSNGHRLVTHSTNTDQNYSTHFGSIISSGFSLPSSQVFNDSLSDPAGTYVAWCWRAGGAPTADNTATSGSMTANSVSVDGVLQSSYTPSGSPSIYPKRMSIGVKQGFSIIKYAGNITSGSATIPHGLNGCDFCLIKNLDNANAWIVSHKSIVPNVACLNDSGAAGSTPPVDGPYGAITQLNSSTITLTSGTSGPDNVAKGGSNWEYIAYCFREIKGFSAFGNYTPNNNANGPFVYTGFLPSLVITKRADGGGNWVIEDNARNPHNPVNDVIYANVTDAGGTTSNTIDFLSNGFKIRHQAWSDQNGTATNILYMAFAEQPINYANAR